MLVFENATISDQENVHHLHRSGCRLCIQFSLKREGEKRGGQEMKISYLKVTMMGISSLKWWSFWNRSFVFTICLFGFSALLSQAYEMVMSIIISQATLILASPHYRISDKQLLVRELAAELVSQIAWWYFFRHLVSLKNCSSFWFLFHRALR